MSERTNRQYRLAARPAGLPKNSDWNVTTEPVPALKDGEMLVQIQYVSVDPAMRGWMNEGRSYIEPVKLGAVMRAGTLGKVVESRNPKFAVGDCVAGSQGVQLFDVTDGKGLRKVDPSLAPLPHYLGGLGMTGLTAYFGLFDVGHPRAGETVVVSGAAGAVGTVTGQLAKIAGCRAVGIAGGAEKCKQILSDGFDAAIDYKSQDVSKALKETCPGGIDVYFDNVGGEILEAALARLARNARVVICGAISQYNATGGVTGPKNYLSLLVNRARMEGFVIFDYAARYDEGTRRLFQWWKEGKLKLATDIVEGLDAFPEALLRLFKGENRGKLVLHVSD